MKIAPTLVVLSASFCLVLAEPSALPMEMEPALETDKSGTNPLNFQNTLGVKNEFNRINDNFANFTRLSYSHPLAQNFKVGVELPLLDTDTTGKSRFGLSDISIKSTWIPLATKRMGVALGGDLIVPTAADDSLGSEKWQVGPSVTVAFILPHSLIFAPAYKQTVSFAGSDSREDINSGALDLYLVWRFDNSQQWLTLDPALLLDYDRDGRASGSVRLTYGRLLTKVGQGALSAFVRPGAGIGYHRPNDWSIESGVTLIGF